MVGNIPPLISVSFSLSQKHSKHTRENIAATKEFTVNIVSEPFAEAANCTAAEAPAEVDEWILSGLTMTPSVRNQTYFHKATGLHYLLIDTRQTRVCSRECREPRV
jgi:flavin reductase (DIM6/NTAB) family NADH-FMN oxidoreductase RutF